jgi:hypothetical protein
MWEAICKQSAADWLEGILASACLLLAIGTWGIGLFIAESVVREVVR